MATWVLVADRTSARLFVNAGRTLSLVRTFEHPEGRTRDQDIEAGVPKRTFDSHARGREGVASPHELSAVQFAKTLSAELRLGRVEKGVREIVLVAEPHFLGLVRQELDEPTRALVVTTIPKDLARADTSVVKTNVDSVARL